MAGVKRHYAKNKRGDQYFLFITTYWKETRWISSTSGNWKHSLTNFLNRKIFYYLQNESSFLRKFVITFSTPVFLLFSFLLEKWKTLPTRGRSTYLSVRMIPRNHRSKSMVVSVISQFSLILRWYKKDRCLAQFRQYIWVII